jgi:hypothetical protein
MARDRLPARTVRDLIAVVRSLYFVWHDAGVGAAKLEELVQMGRDLRDALELSLRSKPGSLEQQAAWLKAERATAALCVVIGAERPADVIALSSRRTRRSRRDVARLALEPFKRVRTR